jgi:peptidoglycan/LPS O-acetylase OafA/YrhL
MTKDSHSTKLDILLVTRGILALSVIVWHVEGYKNEFISFFNIPGRTAVWIFFGISGYVMAYGFLKEKYSFSMEGLKNFYINRFLRIFPLFLLISFFSFITIYLKTGEFLLNWVNLPDQIFMMQFTHSYVLSGVFWTLGIEVQFYLIAPLLSYFLMAEMKYKQYKLIGAYLIMLAWIPASFLFFGWDLDGRNLVSNLPHFFIGMLACTLVMNKKAISIDYRVLVVLIMLIFGGSNFLYQNGSKYYWTMGNIIVDMIILLVIFLHSKLESRTINDKLGLYSFATMLGVISYGTYAWHSYLLSLSSIFIDNLLLAIAATIVVSYLSFRLFEKPILSGRKNLLSKIKNE